MVSGSYKKKNVVKGAKAWDKIFNFNGRRRSVINFFYIRGRDYHI